ncbi:TlpA disulfide reductase family protein [Sphingobacterium tabacisoli]|uniref:Redoxin domain-containing protein n=1 Tax=Sphingobacterium tabacisoli TaxID=2044855 RepID=A0ABW5LA10_9SPHI|nr:TlpA disulfide reductase family protein [Sphingobacterium tabacisoli]
MMKNLIFALFLFFALGVQAQESEEKNPKLEALQNEKDKAVLDKKLKELEDGDIANWGLLNQYYGRDKAKIEAVNQRILKKHPASIAARMIRMHSFDYDQGLDAVEALGQKMFKDYAGINLDMEKTMVALAFAEEPDTSKVMQYINLIEDPYYRIFSITLALDIIGGYNSTMTLDLAQKEWPTALQLKDEKTLSKALEVDPQMAYVEYLTAYAKLLFKAEKYQEAYPLTKEAYERSKDREDSEIAENYAFLSSLNGQYKEALPILADAVKKGKFDKKYIDQVRKGYAALYPGQDVDAYIDELKKDFIDEVKTHVATLMINEAAPDFFVTDVNGKKVSLADFKGKTIVLDFWATWCGPCVESFPAMQMAADRYKEDPSVKFLFIHTWENTKDPLADASSFLAKRNYTFDLYMDPKDPSTKRSPAADAFKVDGIPAKFIIDGNGRVRFTAAGFSGKAEAVAEEVVQMVEMARKGS